MKRISEKLHHLHHLRLFTHSTRFLSLKLLTFSLSSFRFCKSYLSKTLTFIMDDDIFSSSPGDNNTFLEIDHHSAPSTSNHTTTYPSLFLLEDDNDNDDDKLYLVPYRWWSEAEFVKVDGILYDVSVMSDDEEILLNLRKVENTGKSDNAIEGLSCEEYALVPGAMWLRALKWHNDSKALLKIDHDSLLVEDDREDVFPLHIKLSVSSETNSLVVKIKLKENMDSFYRRAIDIFNPEVELLHIWDFSGQTTQFFMNDNFDSLEDSVAEVSLELNMHGFPYSRNQSDGRMDGKTEVNMKNTSFGISSVRNIGSSDYTSSYSSIISTSPRSRSGYRRIGSLGLTGLQNLGNTCFMNSAIQCLAHTPKLVNYFLEDYKREINRENPLGMKGELAFAFGELLRKLWAPGAAPVAPRMFKRKLERFASQFSGYNQHDSQEFLAFLLDGLHEDLNRVKCKPYIETKDAEGRPDTDVADEYWRNHLARNNSIIVDLYQGQYRSTLICPVCKKKSVTFDPFMYLSLPLPSTTMRTMTLTIISSNGDMLPSPVTVTVPKCGGLKDLTEAVSNACALRNDETLLVVEIYKNKIFRFLEEASDALALIRDDDKLVAYRLPKDNEASPLFVFTHELQEKSHETETAMSNYKLFGIPLVTRSSNLSDGHSLQRLYLELLNPFLMPAGDDLNDYDESRAKVDEKDSEKQDVPSPATSDSPTVSDGEPDDNLSFEFQFYVKEFYRESKIEMNEPLKFNRKKVEVLVSWSEKMIGKYDTCILSSLTEVFKPQLYTSRPQESVSLYKCLEAYLKEEPLGPEDMWYCPGCKEFRQASKKLDLWRLPEILIVHLKRFSYSRFMKNKLETYVDFPTENFDLSNYISYKDGQSSNCYELYAISNHYGGMGGGHYTAFVDHGHGRWYEFDDESVSSRSEQRIKASAAYVLFYRRVN
ncbi:Ubiquitin carboxyl-terminal hydrolase 8 [Euphorbia peplus]|nr:Ubiquitin carboxyl-terminal hydrolase 8 [Euphorbia peplus]